LKPETDDVIGEKVKAAIFKGGDEIELEGDLEMRIEELKSRILELAKADIIGVLDSSTERRAKRKRRKGYDGLGH
jgi:hypothetical protein